MSSRPQAIVAMPACNEVARIEACLAALATQRDGGGSPIPAGSFEILIYANNCRDGTEGVARAFAEVCPHPIVVVTERLPPDRANAGWARKRAMDIAAERLRCAGHEDGLILTTDADSCVSPTWFAATLEAFPGVDCVAGYIDAFPNEIMRLGAPFVRRSRLEDRYLSLMAEIHALCDPRPHDPWPNHRISSGASLAVTLAAYTTIGGLPPVEAGEDAALTRTLEASGFLVRRPMTVSVGTSCRFDGRAKGGAADTMRLRHAIVEAPCDSDVEPVLIVIKRALWRGTFRRSLQEGDGATRAWARRLGFSLQEWRRLLAEVGRLPFEACWSRIETESPVLARHSPLRPAELAGQIERAQRLIPRLRSAYGPRARERAGACAAPALAASPRAAYHGEPGLAEVEAS